MLHVDIEACIGCGVCESECTFGAIKVEDGVAVVGDNCTLCGNCVDLCEVGALRIDQEDKEVLQNLDEWSGVWVYAEYRNGRIAPVSFELLGVGRKLANQRKVPLAAVLIGANLDDQAEELISHGADTVDRV